MAADPSPNDRWQIARSESIDWHEWGDEFVVRVDHRAETHLLSAAAGSVLLALLDDRRAMTLESLCSKVCGDPAVESGERREEDVSLVRTIVADLERLGIVTRQAA